MGELKGVERDIAAIHDAEFGERDAVLNRSGETLGNIDALLSEGAVGEPGEDATDELPPVAIIQPEVAAANVGVLLFTRDPDSSAAVIHDEQLQIIVQPTSTDGHLHRLPQAPVTSALTSYIPDHEYSKRAGSNHLERKAFSLAFRASRVWYTNLERVPELDTVRHAGTIYYPITFGLAKDVGLAPQSPAEKIYPPPFLASLELALEMLEPDVAQMVIGYIKNNRHEIAESIARDDCES